jgi:hypothetical protein
MVTFRDIENLAETITTANARELLPLVSCPHCWGKQTLDVFVEPNNNGAGIICQGCGTRHPLLSELGIMWIPSGKKQPKPKRSCNRAEVIERCGSHCYCCGNDLETLRGAGIGWDAHHTRPCAIYGDEYPIIPLCKVCHEITNALQRYMANLLSLIRQPKEPNK